MNPVLMDEIDIDAFNSLLMLDDDDDDKHEFSRGIVSDFFNSTADILGKMRNNLNIRNYGEVSSLGHFLKGSAAAVGARHVRDLCDGIQNYKNNGKDHIFLTISIQQLEEQIKKAEISIKKHFESLSTST